MGLAGDEKDDWLEDEVMETDEPTEYVGPAFRPLPNPVGQGTFTRRNVCFANSAAQALLALPAVQRWLTQPGHIVSPLRLALRDLAEGRSTSTLALIDLATVGASETFTNGEQHDVVEFLHSLIRQEPVLQQMFGFIEKEKTKCSICNWDHDRDDEIHTWLPVRRPVPVRGAPPIRQRLETLIQDHLQDQRKQRCENAFCPDPENNAKAHHVQKRLHFGEDCEVLFMQLHVFLQHTGTDARVVYSDAEVLLPNQLQLGGQSWTPTSAILHRGQSVQSGHYRAYTRHHDDHHDDFWLLKDDANAYRESIPTTLRRPIDQSSVYTIFFTRKTADATREDELGDDEVVAIEEDDDSAPSVGSDPQPQPSRSQDAMDTHQLPPPTSYPPTHNQIYYAFNASLLGVFQREQHQGVSQLMRLYRRAKKEAQWESIEVSFGHESGLSVRQIGEDQVFAAAPEDCRDFCVVGRYRRAFIIHVCTNKADGSNANYYIIGAQSYQGLTIAAQKRFAAAFISPLVPTPLLNSIYVSTAKLLSFHNFHPRIKLGQLQLDYLYSRVKRRVWTKTVRISVSAMDGVAIHQLSKDGTEKLLVAATAGNCMDALHFGHSGRGLVIHLLAAHPAPARFYIVAKHNTKANNIQAIHAWHKYYTPHCPPPSFYSISIHSFSFQCLPSAHPGRPRRNRRHLIPHMISPINNFSLFSAESKKMENGERNRGNL